MTHSNAAARPVDPPGEVEVLIIGAGLSGLYQLHQVRGLGMSVHVVEAGSGVGGTWYWNRYPGARFDSESWTYGYSFSPELLKEWSWSEHFAPQPETLRYANFVADRLDLRRHISFGRRVTQAHWQEHEGHWRVMLDDGRSITARFLITAIGALSAPTLPRIAGIERFGGRWFHTADWPHEPVRFEGQRVAVIGTGATGIQTIQEVAKTAATLTVFQRTANWTAPLRNAPITDDEQRDIKSRFPEIFQRCRESPGGFVHTPDPRSALEVSAEEREALWEARYSTPGFGLWMGNFRDVLINREANALMSEFAARKVRQRVKDPATADKLIPRNHGFGTRRLPLETHYYEVYNQPNVTLVDLREDPIECVTDAGIRTSRGEHALDMIIYATGFDALTGAFDRIDFRGRDGRSLRQQWEGGARTFYGIQNEGFPNLLMVMGPMGSLGNIVRAIEYNVDWVTGLLKHMRDRGLTRVEPAPGGVDDWMAQVAQVSEGLLSNEVDSWMTGVNSNVQGKTTRRLARWSGTAPDYRARADAVVAHGYRGLAMR